VALAIVMDGVGDRHHQHRRCGGSRPDVHWVRSDVVELASLSSQLADVAGFFVGNGINGQSASAAAAKRPHPNR